MKLFYALSMLAFASLPLAYPVAVQSNVVTPFVGSSAATNTSAVTDASAGASTSIDVATENDPDTVIDSVKMDATSNNANTKASSKTPTAAQVKTAAANFAKDANTVSGNINSLGSASSASQIKSMASAAFKAESDEVSFDYLAASSQYAKILTALRTRKDRFLLLRQEAQDRNPTL
jgi:hypothetical protein